MSCSSSFSETFIDQDDVLYSGYVHQAFSTIYLVNKITDTLKLRAKASTRIRNDDGSTTVVNNGFVRLNFFNGDWMVSKSIDVNRNISMRVEKLLRQDFIRGHTIFGKIDKSPYNDSQQNPILGIYKNFDNFAYKAKFNFESQLSQFKLKTSYDTDILAKEQFGAGVAANYNFKQNSFSRIKSLLYYRNLSTTMSLKQLKIYNNFQITNNQILNYQNSIFSKVPRLDENEQPISQIQSSLQYSLSQKFTNNLTLAVEMNHNSTDKKINMLFGGQYSKFSNIVCRAKINDKLVISSSVEIDINPSVKFTVSNMIDASLNSKKDIYTFPVGFKLDIFQ